jgi:hypothetical protein
MRSRTLPKPAPAPMVLVLIIMNLLLLLELHVLAPLVTAAVAAFRRSREPPLLYIVVLASMMVRLLFGDGKSGVWCFTSLRSEARQTQSREESDVVVSPLKDPVIDCVDQCGCVPYGIFRSKTTTNDKRGELFLNFPLRQWRALLSAVSVPSSISFVRYVRRSIYIILCTGETQQRHNTRTRDGSSLSSRHFKFRQQTRVPSINETADDA